MVLLDRFFDRFLDKFLERFFERFFERFLDKFFDRFFERVALVKLAESEIGAGVEVFVAGTALVPILLISDFFCTIEFSS
jgi:hypothetical protein